MIFSSTKSLLTVSNSFIIISSSNFILFLEPGKSSPELILEKSLEYTGVHTPELTLTDYFLTNKILNLNNIK
jgi:hypothetical protein